MAKVQNKFANEARDDGLREKMIAVNRVTKVVKGGRILGFAALTVVATAMVVSAWVKARRVKCLWPFKRPWSKRVAIW
jgi:SSU ribosomal protein S5P